MLEFINYYYKAITSVSVQALTMFHYIDNVKRLFLWAPPPPGGGVYNSET